MSSPFVPLAAFLRPTPSDPAVEPVSPQRDGLASVPDATDRDEAIRAARRFRAALADALEAAIEELLPRIARDVLARELELRPVEIRAIVAAACNRFECENVLAVRVHPDDLAALHEIEFERVADRTLERGDVALQLRSGTIDVTLSARLDAALAALA